MSVEETKGPMPVEDTDASKQKQLDKENMLAKKKERCFYCLPTEIFFKCYTIFNAFFIPVQLFLIYDTLYPRNYVGACEQDRTLVTCDIPFFTIQRIKIG